MVEDVFGILGTTLAGAFHVEEVIAEGGFGVVYRAEHVAFRAPVALKCLKIPGTISPGQSEVFVENFREEAEILFHLSAQIPEVVRPLHADAITLDDGTFVPYLAMEWIDGKPLDSIIILRQDDGLPPLDIRAVLKMLSPIAHALSKAHRFQVPGGAIVSVTHCDLKPENIVVTERETPVRAKILDFGIARARDMMRQNVGRITDSEASRPFTPSYGAPEQWVPKRYGQSGPWTDVWGLALTCVECLTGDPPIDGDMHAMMGTCLDRGRRPTPRTEGAEVSDEVEEVFLKALAVDPRDRYNDIESFWSALEDAVGVPSSFERARRRRARPTYDYDRSSELPPLPEEFDGLEIEESAEQEPSTSDFPSIPPPPPRISPQSRSSLEAVIDDPYEEDEGPFSAR
ncbi:MAG: serine/threonine protein kinase [Myxococcales bacterium]|nr:serine/threonine protein kinase [Myxococcales bacterium]